MYQVCITNNKGFNLPSVKTLTFSKALALVCLNSTMFVRVYEGVVNDTPVFSHKGFQSYANKHSLSAYCRIDLLTLTFN